MNSTVTIEDVQVHHAGYGVAMYGGKLVALNVLMHDMDLAFFLDGAPGDVENLTLDQCSWLWGSDGDGRPFALTNSIIISTADLSYIPLVTNSTVFLSTNTGVFSGDYYLATNSPYRDMGTTNINTNLLAELQITTTFPPATWSNRSFAPPDNDGLPDLGYHSHLTGDSDGDDLLDSWEFTYFGTLAFGPTNADSAGNTLLYDYQNAIDPNHPRRDVGLLSRWRFDTTNRIGDQGQIPLANTNVQLVSGVSSNAVQITNLESDLRYNVVESNGHTNLILTNGTVRFWFKPNWSSVDQGGDGLDDWGILFETPVDIGFLGLYFYPDGSTMEFDSGDGTNWNDSLVVPISWRSNEWHQIALTFSPSNAALYIDGILAGSGPSGIIYFPAGTQLMLGNDSWNNAAKGDFDELETYNYPLDSTSISNDFANSLFRPPLILHQPQSKAVVAGSNVTFSVSANGTPPLKYQWYHDSVLLAAATNATLTMTNILATDAGAYVVLVSNAVASVLSSDAALMLADIGSQDGLLSRWHFDDTEWLGEQGQVPIAQSGIALAAGKSSRGAKFSYIPGFPVDKVQYRLVEPNGATNLNAHEGSFIFWYKPDWTSLSEGGNGPQTYGSLIRVGSNSASFGLHFYGDGNTLYFYTASGGTAEDWISATVTWHSNEWHQIGLVYDSNSVTLYIDGASVGSGGSIPQVDYDNSFTLGNSGSVISGVYDELETFNRELAAGEIAADFSRFSEDAPSVLTQPQTQTVVASGTAKFSVVSAGGAPLSYQWYFNTNTPIPGATSAHLNLANVQSTNDGTYDVVVTNSYGAVTSSIVSLTVIPGISITNPADGTSFNASRIIVQGTFTGTDTRQVTVNGVLAFLGSNTFDALNVPLEAGTNTIVAVAEDWDGNTNLASITIIGLTNADGTLNEPVQLQATPIAGFSPLQVTFTIQTNLPGTIQQVFYDFNGDDVIDLVTNNISSLNYTYPTNGEFFPVVTIRTTAGSFSSSGGWNSIDPNRLRINVQAQPQVLATINITDPVDLKWTATSNLYVLSGSTATITEFDSSTNVIRTLSGIGSNPSGLDVDAAGNVYVAVTGDNKVWKFIPTNSTFQADTSFGTSGFIGLSSGASGTNNGEFNAPYDVAVAPDGGTISVSDSGNSRIQQFSTTNGVFINSFGQQGSGIGQFNSPKGLAYDGAGYLYIVDSGNNRVALALSSAIIGASGTNGTMLGQFQAAINLGVGSRGIYVADAGNNRMQWFDPIPTGHDASPTPFSSRGSVSSQVSPSLSQPRAVAPVADLLEEKIYIADTGNNRVLLINLPSNNPTGVWTSMKTRIAAGDIPGASLDFSIATRDDYRKAFFSDQAALSAVSEIGTLTPVFIMGNAAQSYFTDTIDGQTITFPVQFVKENGEWKILEF